MGAAPLVIDFIDERYEVEPGSIFTFGRAGDLIVDESNPYLHRHLGTLQVVGEVWTLTNAGRNIAIRVVQGGTTTDLAPGGTTALFGPGVTISFEAAGLDYEIECFVDSDPTIPPAGPVGGDVTRDWGRIPLNDEQRLLLVALAEPRLRGTGDEVPANAATAAKLGWPITKFNRKLDYMCRKYTEAGVPGLFGGQGGDASDRRQKLVDHVLLFGIVTTDDLAALDGPAA